MNQFAFVAQGRLYLQTPRGVREMKSHFGEAIRRREMDIRERNAWKTQGTGARFMGFGMSGGMEADPAEMPIHVTGVSRGTKEGELLYTLETPGVCGLLRSEKLGEEEQRLWHCNERRIRDLSRHPTESRVACSLRNANGTSSIAAMNGDGSGLQQFTEGDSVDLSPRWVPDSSTKLVFQSAGIGRNQDGVVWGLGPFCVQEIDTISGELEMVVEDPERDILNPQFDGEGRLHFIRRPYQAGVVQPWWKTLLDVLLLPWRLLQALFGFLNFFAMMFTGKPLITPAGGPPRQVDAGRMMLWGNLIDAQKAMRAGKGDAAPDLVPKSWELVRRERNGAETTLVRGVLSYDLRADGSVLYSNGSAVFLRAPDGKVSQLAQHNFIEQVVSLEG